jgi:hypothetical protein
MLQVQEFSKVAYSSNCKVLINGRVRGIMSSLLSKTLATNMCWERFKGKLLDLLTIFFLKLDGIRFYSFQEKLHTKIGTKTSTVLYYKHAICQTKNVLKHKRE